MKDPWQKFGFISCRVRTGVEKTKTEKKKTLQTLTDTDIEVGETEDPEDFEDWNMKIPMLSPMGKYSPQPLFHVSYKWQSDQSWKLSFMPCLPGGLYPKKIWVRDFD